MYVARSKKHESLQLRYALLSIRFEEQLSLKFTP
jgi:hypothetical protein